MTFNQSKLLSGRVPVTDYANLTSDRYQFLSVNQAEPNLGPGDNSTILTITTSNTRVWSNSFSVTGNIGGNYVYGNGAFLTGVQTSGSPVTNQTITGDGSTVDYTLTSTSTADAILVTTNGLAQAPDVDYTVAGNTITFTTAPAQGDVMQIRYLANNLTAINNNYGNSNVAAYLPIYSGNISAGNVSTTGNIMSGNLLAWQLYLDPPAGSGGGGGIVFNNSFSEIYYNTVTNGMDVVAKAGPLYLWGNGNTVNRGIKLITSGGVSYFDYTGNLSIPNSFSAAGNITGNCFIGNGSQLTNIPTQATGSWTLAAGTNTVSLTVPGPGTYSIWVNGNIPNGIVTYTATVVVTNNNVPVVGSSYGWYYAAGNALVLTAIPTQIVGSLNTISTAVVATTTANVFEFGITNNSGNSAAVSYGYTRL